MTARTDTDVSSAESGHDSHRAVAYAAASSLGVAAAGLAGIIALALVAWTIDHPEGASAGSAAIVGLQAWLLSNGASLAVGGGALSVPPLLVTALIGYAMYRTGRGLARRFDLRTGWALVESTVAVALTYVTVALILTAPGTTTAVRPGLLKLCLIAAALSIVPTVLGMLVESGLGPRLVASMPGSGVAVARSVSACLVGLIGLGALQLIMGLVVHFSGTSALTAAAGGTTGGAITIVGVAICFVPNALLAIIAFGSGAGFSLGSGTAIGLTGVKLGPLPAFPLFGLLPADAGPLSWFSVLIPLGAAVFAGIVLVRSLEPDERAVHRVCVAAASCAVIVGIIAAAVATIAVGGIGRERLAQIGVAPLRLGALLAVLTLIGTLAGALIARGIAATESRRPDILAESAAADPADTAAQTVEKTDQTATAKSSTAKTTSDPSTAAKSASESSTSESNSAESSPSEQSTTTKKATSKIRSPTAGEAAGSVVAAKDKTPEVTTQSDCDDDADRKAS